MRQLIFDISNLWQSVHYIKSSRKDYNASCKLEILKPSQFHTQRERERKKEIEKERGSLWV